MSFTLACARPSLVKEESDVEIQHLKPSVGDPAGPNPAGQRLATSLKRVLRGVSQGALRSVDSECEGRVIEPRKKLFVGAVVLQGGGGSIGTPKWPGVSARPGSKSRADAHRGPPRNLGGPVVSQ